MAANRIVRFLFPTDTSFYDTLEAQAKVAHDAATVLQRLREPSESAERIRTEVQDLEHKGDELFRAMEDSLSKTFVTPIDREDLLKLSTELDDIVDRANIAIRAFVLYGATRPSDAMNGLVDRIAAATGVLVNAFLALRKADYAAVLAETRSVRTLEKEGDLLFRESLSALFRDVTMDPKCLIRDKELLEDFEETLDRCDDLADTLVNLTVKHG